jgi:hypothetical protein
LQWEKCKRRTVQYYCMLRLWSTCIMDAILADAIKQALGTYPQIRKKYYEDVFAAVYDYLDGEGSVTKFKNAMKRAMVEAFNATETVAWEDGGGTPPVDEDTREWITAMQDAELSYIDVLFQSLKSIRGDEELKIVQYSQDRAAGYAATLDRIYNHAKVAAAGSKMLTFAGDDGAESCSDCSKYKGKRRRASWWVKNNAVPPNRDFECKGYNCRHVLVDDSGKVWTL